MTQAEIREAHRLQNRQAELLGKLVEKWGTAELQLIRLLIEQELRHRLSKDRQ